MFKKTVCSLLIILFLLPQLPLLSSNAENTTYVSPMSERFKKLMDPTSPYYFDIEKGTKEMVLGEGMVYQIKENGDLWGWGSTSVYPNGDEFMQFNSAGGFFCTLPIKIMSDVLAVSATQVGYSGYTTFVIKKDHSLWGWGDNQYGQLYLSNKSAVLTPIKMMDGVKAVSISNGSVLALKMDGKLYAWGMDIADLYPEPFSKKPALVLSDVQAMTQCFSTAVAIKKDQSLWGWGSNISGAISMKASRGTLSKPIKIADKVKKAVLTSNTLSYLKTDGAVYSLGISDVGQLGVKLKNPHLITQPIKISSNCEDIFSGYGPVYMLKKDKTLWSWGNDNKTGVLGTGKVQSFIDVPVKIADNIKTVAAGGETTAMIKTDGKICMTGSNLWGEFFIYPMTDAVYGIERVLSPVVLSYDEALRNLMK